MKYRITQDNETGTFLVTVHDGPISAVAGEYNSFADADEARRELHAAKTSPHELIAAAEAAAAEAAAAEAAAAEAAAAEAAAAEAAAETGDPQEPTVAQETETSAEPDPPEAA